MLSMAAILFERRQERALRRERVFRDRSNPLGLLPASEVKRRFRFSPETIMELVHIIGPSIEHPTARNHALQPVEMILILLRFLSCGTFQLVIGDTTNFFPGNCKQNGKTFCRCDSWGGRQVHLFSTCSSSAGHQS